MIDRQREIHRQIGYTWIFIWGICWLVVGALWTPSLQGEEIQTLVKKVAPSVVRVESFNATRKVATGVVIEEGYILTTALITPGKKKIYVVDTQGRRTKAELVGFDPLSNLALIKSQVKLPPIKKGKSDYLGPGSWIGVVGLSPENKPAVTQGIVSSVTEDRLRLNIWVFPGSSGSPVIDKKGRLVGVLRGIYFDEQPVVFEFREKELVGSGYVVSRAQAPASGMALAVPVEIAVKVARKIKDKGRVVRGWMGVRVIENEAGEVEIYEVEKDSPAELAGLEKGDVILEVDGRPVNSTRELATLIQLRDPGEVVKLRLRRRGREKEIELRLGEYPEEDFRRESERKLSRWFPQSWPEFPPPTLKWTWKSRRYIGLYLQELTRELSAYFGVKEGRGLLVSRVEEGSPADEAGLKVGDVILRADGRRVEKVEELSRIVQGKEEGEKIEIEFLRDKKLKKVEVEVAEEKGSFGAWFNWEVKPRFREYLSRWSKETRKVSQETWSKWQQKMREISKKAEENLTELSRKLKEMSQENLFSPEKLVKQRLRGLRV